MTIRPAKSETCSVQDATRRSDSCSKTKDESSPWLVTSESGGTKQQKLAQFSQIPPDVLLELAEHYGKGVAKYPDNEAGQPNWQRGYDWRLSVDALGRHLLAFLSGEDLDPETGSSHLTAVMWHAMALRWFQLHGVGRDFRETK